jgi:hypothetical protein
MNSPSNRKLQSKTSDESPILAASDSAGDSDASEIGEFFQTFRFPEPGGMEQSPWGTFVPWP